MWTAGRRLTSGVAGVAVALLVGAVAPATAAADTTYCMPSASIAGCPAGATAEPTVAAALAAVNQDSGAHDVVRIGPGTFDEGNLSDNQGHRVDIIGEGEGATVLAPSSVPPTIGFPGVSVLYVGEPSSTVTNLSIEIPPGDYNEGLYLDSGSTANDVAITAAPTATHTIGVEAYATAPSSPAVTLNRVRLTLPEDGTGIVTGFEAQATVQDSTILAGTGVVGSGLIQRSRIDANVDLLPTGYSPLVVDSSVLEATSGPNPEAAVSATTVPPFYGSGGEQQVLLRQDTLLGDGASGSAGIVCTSGTPQGVSNTCTVEADDSIIWGFEHALVRAADSTSGNAFAAISIWGCDLDPTTDENTEITPPNPGLTDGGTGILPVSFNVRPGFASTNPASPMAWELLRGSPLIDFMGEPYSPATTWFPVRTATPESSTDFYGRPRLAAAHRGGFAFPDIGATEYQASPPTVTVSPNGSAVVAGTAVQFTATASDPDPGDAVSIEWDFDNGQSYAGAVIAHTFVAPGKHTIDVIVSDLDGNSVTSVVHITVTAPSPHVTKTRLGSASFRVAASGPSILPVRRHGGTTISYFDSWTATATMIVLERLTGVRHGHACLASPGHGGSRGHPCTRWIRVGSFKHHDRRGRNAFRFSGRLAGKGLTPGRYVVELTARNSTGSSAMRRLSFTILP